MGKKEIVEAFISKLGNVDHWDYKGNMYILEKTFEKCVCGCEIKVVFEIENEKTGKKEKVGSTCINHFKNYNDALYKKLVAAEKKRHADKRKALKAKEDLKNNEEYKLLQAEIEIYRDKLLKVKETWGTLRLPYGLWSALNSLVIECPREYKKTSSYVKWAITQKELGKKLTQNCQQWENTKPIPEELAEDYKGRIWFGEHVGKKISEIPIDYVTWLSKCYRAYDKKELDLLEDLKKYAKK